MKIELYKVVQAYESFTNLQKSNALPFKLAWDVADLLEPLEKHYKRFLDEKNKLIKEYGEPDEKNKEMYMIKSEKMEVFNTKFEEIGKIEIDIKAPVKIDKKALFDGDIKINGNSDLQAMKIFIKE